MVANRSDDDEARERERARKRAAYVRWAQRLDDEGRELERTRKQALALRRKAEGYVQPGRARGERVAPKRPEWVPPSHAVPPRPACCGHCGARRLFRDDLDLPPSWYCLCCGWRPVLEPLPLVITRDGQQGKERPSDSTERRRLYPRRKASG